MRSVTQKRHGSPEVFGIPDVAEPGPWDDKVLARRHATSVTPSDAMLHNFDGARVFWLLLRLMLGILEPGEFIPRMDFAGTVEASDGKGVEFRAGEPDLGMKPKDHAEDA